VSGKLKSREDTLTFTQRQLEEANKNILKINNINQELDQKLNVTRNEANSTGNALQKERNNRQELEKANERLEIIIKEKTNDIKRYNLDLENSRAIGEKLGTDKAQLINETERYKNHIMILTEQNQKLSEELDVISERDERIRQQLNRKEKLSILVNKNKSFVEQSLSNLDEYLNKSTRALSPNYNRKSNNSNI